MSIGQYHGWMDHMMSWGMWMAPWGWIFIIILVVILIYAISGRGGQRTSDPSRLTSAEGTQYSETPMNIVKKRYARGEISREDFEQMKKDLSS